MSVDGKILAQAKQRLEDKKRRFERQLDSRKKEVNAKCPRVAALDREIKNTIIEVVGLSLRSGSEQGELIAQIRDKNLSLQAERIQALISSGFSPDYIDNEYLCDACRDTGYIGTELCACLKKCYEEESQASLSSLFRLGSETFDSFDLSWYDDTFAPEIGTSPRRHMESICEACFRYASKFSSRSTNLFLNGDTGLGKTFLSACVARVVVEKGFSVVYNMACSIFSAFEEEKFTKSSDPAVTRDEIRRYLDCDLLIIDDLGTEMTTAFTISVLYELINSRLISQKKTIISSNLSFDELRRRYSNQIMSRLEGEFQVLKFFGRDIRLLKKSL